MAAAIVSVVRRPNPIGDVKMTIVDFTPSDSYPAGGEPMTASLFGLQTVLGVIPLGSPRASAAVMPVYDSVNNQLALYTTSTGAKVSTSSDQSSNPMRLMIIGL